MSETATAEEAGNNLSITPADTIHYCELLLERVRGDEYSALAGLNSQAYQNCSDLLSQLRTTLEQLRQKLRETRSNGLSGVSPRLDAIDRNLAYLQHTGRHTATGQNSFLIPTTTALETLIGDLAKNCDLDPDGEVKALLDKALNYIQSENKSLAVVEEGHAKWQQASQEIEALCDRCKANMENASASIVAATEHADARKHISRAREYLRSARAELAQLPAFSPTVGEVGRSPAKEALDGFLHAIEGAVVSAPRALPVAYSRQNGSEDSVPSLQLDRSNSTLISYVSAVVHNRQYFWPGIAVQVVTCISVCWPVWVFYLDEREADTRRRLIEQAVDLHLCWGARVDKSHEIAEKLERAYLTAIGSSRS